MIQHARGNIVEIKAEILINAANGKGWMGGWIGRFIPLKGVAESIHYKDPTIEYFSKREAKKLNVKCGDIFFTEARTLNFPKGILHAVTMRKPGHRSNINVVEICLDNILSYCEKNKIKTVAIPLLGAGTGGIAKEDIIDLYNNRLDSSNTCFYVVQIR